MIFLLESCNISERSFVHGVLDSFLNPESILVSYKLLFFMNGSLIREPTLSLSVVSEPVVGSTDYTTMRVRGTQGKKNLYILLDSGSTHNFIDTKIAEILGVCGKVSNLRWKFLNYEFKADFMVIPLGGHDIVLGVQWLSTLGDPITWDFKELEMSFKWHNKRVMLHGIKAGSVREVKAKRLESTKEEDIQLHVIYACEEEEIELWNLKTEALEEMNEGGRKSSSY